jgi:hypothetical protein
MPYTFARLPAVVDKTKNLPGVDTSEITRRRRILTVGSFVSVNTVLNTQKSVQQAYQAIRSSNQGNIVQVSGLTRSLLADDIPAPTAPSSPINLLTSVTNITSTTCDCTVSWSLPTSDGRSPIIEYGITGSPGNLSGTTDPLTTTFTFTGLLLDTLYTFTVTATNIIGFSLPATVSVTTPTSPSSPTDLVTNINTNSSTYIHCTVSWSAPTSDGRTPITEYSITGSPDNLSATTDGSARTSTFTGLSSDTLYTFTVTATNIIGSSVPATVTVRTPVVLDHAIFLADGSDSLIIQTSPIASKTWTTRITGATALDPVNSVTTDSNGNVTVNGYFNSTLIAYNKNSSPFANTLSPVGRFNTFVVQYSSTGSVNWVAQIGEPGGGPGSGDYFSNGILSDSNGDLTVAGYFTNSPTLVAYDNNNTPFTTTLTNAGGYDVFIVQYSSSGSVNWVARIAGTGSELSRGQSIDSNGNINITGYFDSTLTAYNKNNTPFTTTLSPVNGYDAFVLQYSSSGSVNWVARIGGTGTDYSNSITTDSSGNITVTGGFDSPTLTAYNKDNTPFGTTLSFVGSGGNFTTKYNSAGYVTMLS